GSGVTYHVTQRDNPRSDVTCPNGPAASLFSCGSAAAPGVRRGPPAVPGWRAAGLPGGPAPARGHSPAAPFAPERPAVGAAAAVAAPVSLPAGPAPRPGVLRPACEPAPAALQPAGAPGLAGPAG